MVHLVQSLDWRQPEVQTRTSKHDDYALLNHSLKVSQIEQTLKCHYAYECNYENLIWLAVSNWKDNPTHKSYSASETKKWSNEVTFELIANKWQNVLRVSFFDIDGWQNPT